MKVLKTRSLFKTLTLKLIRPAIAVVDNEDKPARALQQTCWMTQNKI